MTMTMFLIKRFIPQKVIVILTTINSRGSNSLRIAGCRAVLFARIAISIDASEVKTLNCVLLD
jgi:hypothetical protein